MAGNAGGAKGTGRLRGSQGKTTVTRARSAGKDKSDPGPRQTSEAPQHSARRGQMAPAKPTADSGAPFPQGDRGSSSVPLRGGRTGLREKQPGDPSIFEKAGARNRMLGQRNRPTA